MNERVTSESMRRYVEMYPDRVRAKAFDNQPGLIHLSYKRKTFFKGLWDAHNRLCRGTVVRESDFEPVLMPFPKIFDYGTPESRVGRDSMVHATCKVNGFMIGVAAHPFVENELLLSTTGSLNSPFVDLAAHWIEPFKDAILKELESREHTFIFEVVDQENDPHIVEESSGLYLIGRRTNLWGGMFNHHPIVLDILADRMGVRRPESFTCMMQSDVHEMNKTTHTEGFIVESVGAAYKLKSPYYRVIKYLGRLGEKKLEMFVNDREQFLNNSYQKMLPEYNSLLNAASAALQGETLNRFLSVDSVARIMMLRGILDEN